MSTRSRIGVIRGIAEQDGHQAVIVESIYCHFDGYPEGVGQTLIDHWTDPKKVNRLIALGDLSSLGTVIGKKHDFDRHLPDFYGEENEAHLRTLSDEDATAFRMKLDRESPHGMGWCCAYGRDRGEKDVGSRLHGLDNFPDYGQEAEYLFDPHTCLWRVRREALNPVGWNTVTPWDGWITIPEAIALEVAERERYEREHATA